MQHAALQNSALYPMQYGIAAAPPRGGFLTYLRAASLSVWMFTLVFRFWWLSNWFAVVEQMEAGVDARAYYYIGFGIAIAAHLTLGVAAWFALPFFVTSTWSGRIFTLFCVLEFLLAPLSQVPRASMIYSAATWGVYALFCLYWQSDYRIVRRMTVFAGMVVLAWLFILMFKHGLTLGFGGAIGGINRNTTATAGVGAMICCLLTPNKKLYRAAIAAGVFMAVVVSSRGSMVALAAFFAVYYTISQGTVKAAVYAFGAFTIFGIALLASPHLQDIVLERILHIHDKNRGIGSGFTGRLGLWQQGLESFWERPILGWGFRSTTYGAGHGGVHSGYIKMLIETGFVGTIIMLTAMLVELARRVRLGIIYRQLTPAAAPGIDVEATARINAVVAGTIAMTMVVWVYEQLYINLGSTASLVFFLMMAAPAYITTQGVTIRRWRGATIRMSACRSPESALAEVLAVGPLPPPFTGMAMLTEKIVERMQQVGPVKVLNVSPGDVRNRLAFRARRFLNTLSSLGRLALRGRARGARLYVVANSKGGLLTTLALVNAGRLLGYAVYLHHHTYFYIDRFDWRMARINRSLGPRGVHVVHCPQMASDFRARYAGTQPFEYVLPSVFSLPLAAPRQAPQSPMRVGHLGNLSVEKGLDLVLDTFRELLRSGRSARLRLAGPYHTNEARCLVAQALHEYPDSIEYVGPVYGDAKADYFRSIDCFVMPSRSESWGIVLNEAMAASVPVIACRRGCTETLVGDRAGLVVKDVAQYVQLAVRQIQTWMDDAAQYRVASEAAIQQAAMLDREGQAQLNAFAKHMLSPLAASTEEVRCRSHQPC